MVVHNDRFLWVIIGLASIIGILLIIKNLCYDKERFTTPRKKGDDENGVTLNDNNTNITGDENTVGDTNEPVIENYGIVAGALAPYNKEIVECTRRCNMSDARSILFSGYNIGCNQYCENLFSKKARDYRNEIIPDKGYISFANSYTGIDEHKNMDLIPNSGGKPIPSSPLGMKPLFQSDVDKCNELCGVDVDFLANYSPSDIPPPFALSSDDNILLPIDNPGYVRNNVFRNQQKRCVNKCTSKYSIANYCAIMDCPYSTLPTDLCMRDCIDRRSGSDSFLNWTWDINNV